VQSATRVGWWRFAARAEDFAPSCTGRRICATAAHLIEEVLPEVALRQWVLTFASAPPLSGSRNLSPPVPENPASTCAAELCESSATSTTGTARRTVLVIRPVIPPRIWSTGRTKALPFARPSRPTEWTCSTMLRPTRSSCF
jgi:hypothetical protein